MQTNYLLPNKYKILGWVLFILGIAFGAIHIFYNDYETKVLTTNVLAIYSDPLFGESGFFKIIKNSVVDELVSLAIIFGGLIIAFSKEKVEDEFIYKLRKDSLVWAIIFNYLILTVAIIFIYDMTFFHVLIFNIFTPLAFFIFRFNFLKLKSGSDEE